VAQEDIDRMRAGYEAMGRGDFNAVLDLMDPEIEIRDRPEIPDPQTYRGREGVLTALSRNLDSFDDLEMVPESFVEGGDQMVVCILLRGRGRISGVPVEDRLAHLWTIRDGRAVALQVYSDPAEALRAAGLPDRS
jgi:ketosteroid isomerase-like protein